MLTASRAGRLSGAAVLAAAALLAGAPPGAAVEKVVIGGGAGIVVEGDTYCTLTAVGNDRTGALIGFTSAHCGAPGRRSLRRPLRTPG